ncbi:ubiquinol-cytochrome c reductase iron-sulfur subunit [Microbulbifer flavimaris]|uniref:Ubiquinol-cytochrome c reductase iron-sulfur subunit n=1 Tax=Microbulbifer flavimaris TaxID=1781068 RepID=A0ABX4HZ07_9GAMM|nr:MULTISPECIES: ubiquinol-cytochrome c reductase iron-sulfur subunit [Microbulbifer]KUJ83243.1 ubiquinol-cytochrome c reductase iron-sulfur subunit [Microbulbifer sp. ZGT114]PCO05390.1 ubiquinol-cytochrome c reductase iron-sulfur subunit [Microbulbifer flavimaris]
MSDDGVNVGRRRFLTAATSVVGGVGAVGVAVPFVKSWNPSAKAKAAGAPVKFNVSKMEPGQMVTVEWRGKPVYVVRRSDETLQNLEEVTPLLRDPNSEESIQPAYVNPQNRAIKPHLLVLVGLCTHLGCAPMFRPEVGATDLGGDEWLGGFFCPCHGSKYDMAGRVYTGVPAPTNMDVPPYSFEGDDIIVIGVDQEGSA